MLLNPLSLIGSSYADNSLTWSAQRTLNWLPETAEVDGTRTPIKFADVPGLREVVDLGTGAPIRGMENVEGKLFAVSGSSLFEIGTDFAATNLGNIPGVTRVSMAHNKQGGVSAANELVIANGLSGYVYNTSTQALVQITDDAFQGATTVDYVDGYITFSDPQGRFWGHSALNQATSFSSIDRYDAESAPDPIISHIVSHREVMVFGTRTTEFFRNTGAATGTFQRVDGTELEVGICAPFARARIDNSVCWVSDSLEVFRLEGHAPQRISTRPIEQMLHTVNPANVFAFAWEDKGHKVFYITAPEAFTLGFDFASGMWHERQTFDLPRWRANAAVAWNGLWIVGDYSNGLLYALDWDTHDESGLPIVRERASGYTHGGQNKVLAPYVELLFDTGTENPVTMPPVITGDLPDGLVGDSGSGAYTVTGGVAPYGTIAVISGTPPPGFTLNPGGTYTYDYTTRGTYNFIVGGVDDIGQLFSVADSVTICEQIVGNTVTHTGTLAGDDRVATLAYRDDGLLNFAAGAFPIAVSGSLSHGSLTSTLAQTGTGAYTVQAGSPGDARLWAFGTDEDGWTYGDDDNFNYAELWLQGVFQARVKPTVGDPDGWNNNNAFGGQAQICGNGVWTKDGFVYVGIRKVSSGTISGKVYKWPLAASGSVVTASAISAAATTDVIEFAYCLSIGRDGVIRVLDPTAGTLSVLAESDLSVVSSVSVASIGNLGPVRAFVVDRDKLIVYRGDITKTVTAYRLSDLSLLATAAIGGTVYEFNNKLLCTEDSIILHSGTHLSRIDYALVCTP